MDEKAYRSRLKEAADFGDLDAIADLIVDGAKGSRILPDDEVEWFAKGIRKGDEKHDVHKHIAHIIIGVLALVVIVLVS